MTSLEGLLGGLGLNQSQIEEVEWTAAKENVAKSATPAGGRYGRHGRGPVAVAGDLHELVNITSDFALNKFRVKYTVEYAIALSDLFADYNGIYKDKKLIKERFSDEKRAALRSLAENFSMKDYFQIKLFESKSDHDLAAATDWIKYEALMLGILNETEVDALHFGLTSANPNVAAFGMMNDAILRNILLPKVFEFADGMYGWCKDHDRLAPGLTHKQPAEPTTFRRKFAGTMNGLRKNLIRLIDSTDPAAGFQPIRFPAGLGGAIGNYTNLYAAFPDIDWMGFGKKFIESLGLKFELVTDQSIDYVDYLHHFTAISGIANEMWKIGEDLSNWTGMQWLLKEKKKGAKASSVLIGKTGNAWKVEGAKFYLDKGINSLFHSAIQFRRYPHEGNMERSGNMRELGNNMIYVCIGLDRTLAELKSWLPWNSRMDRYFEDNPSLVGSSAQNILKREAIKGDAYRVIQDISFDGNEPVNRQRYLEKLEAAFKDGKIPEEYRKAGHEIRKRLCHPDENIGQAKTIANEAERMMRGTIQIIKQVYGLEGGKSEQSSEKLEIQGISKFTKQVL